MLSQQTQYRRFSSAVGTRDNGHPRVRHYFDARELTPVIQSKLGKLHLLVP